jgi:hypothetical protein
MTAVADRSTPPDLAVGVGLVAVGYLLGSLGPCLILLARDLDVPRGELTWLAGGFGVSLLLFGVAGTWLLSAGPVRLLRGTAAGLAAGIALLAAAPSVVAAQAGALLAGVGGAGLVLAAPTLLAGTTLAARLTRVNAASSIASVSAPLFISAVDATTGNGRLALLLPLPALVWLVVVPLRRTASASIDSPFASIDSASAPSAAPHDSMRLESATSRGSVPAHTPLALRAAVGWLCIVLAVSAEFAFLVWGAARLQDSGLRAPAAAAAAAAFPIGMAAGRLVAPLLPAALPIVTLGAGLAVAAALAVAAPLTAPLLTAAMAVAGLGIAVLYPVMLARLVRTPGLGPDRGAALGAAASGTAALASPILLDQLAGPAGLRTAFLVVAPLLLVMLALRRASARWAAPGTGLDR